MTLLAEDPKKRGKRRATALAAAVAHPIRCRALVILTEGIASPAAISREILIDVKKVDYHVNALADADLIEEVDSRKVRGATEHFWRSVAKPVVTEKEEAGMSVQERKQVAENILSIYAAGASVALESGTLLRRPDHHLTRHSLDLDEIGWRELSEAHMELYERAATIEEMAAARMSEAEEEPSLRAVSFQSLFEVQRRRT